MTLSDRLQKEATGQLGRQAVGTQPGEALGHQTCGDETQLLKAHSNPAILFLKGLRGPRCTQDKGQTPLLQSLRGVLPAPFLPNPMASDLLSTLCSGSTMLPTLYRPFLCSCAQPLRATVRNRQAGQPEGPGADGSRG